MKTLFVTHHYLNGFGGGVYASRSLATAFARLSEKMTLLCPAKADAMPEGLDGSIAVVPVFDGRSRLRKAVSLVLWHHNRFQGPFEEAIRDGDYDTVVFDSCYPSFRLVGKAHLAGCKVITIHHNFQLEYVRDNYRFPGRGVRMFWTRRIERASVRESDLNLCLTPSDARLLLSHYAGSGHPVVRVIGLFEGEGRPRFPANDVSGNVFLITGDLGIRQTRDSLLSWLKEYYPVLLRRVPDAQLILAGKNPHPDICAFCESHQLELIAYPPSTDPILARGRYYICPVSLGGGIKLRILDGLSHGMPVISHKVSARGYEPFIGTVLFPYDSPESFGQALDRMLGSTVSGDSILDEYQRIFSFPAGKKRLEEILAAEKFI